MNRVFADTFYWVALTSVSDPAHEWALSNRANVVVTTQEVLTEFLNYFSSSQQVTRRRAVATVAMVLSSRDVRVIPQVDESFRAGMRLYASRPDKGYSLTDCISMNTMRQERLTDVLTNDRHFEEEGFRALFRVH